MEVDISKSKVKYGDVFEIKTEKGFGYFQCIKVIEENKGEIVRVFSGVYSNPEEVDFESLVKEKESYFVHFFTIFSLKAKMVRKVGNYRVPKGIEAPKYYRTPEIIKGEFICWYIVDRDTLKRRRVDVLTSEEKKLSPWGYFNHKLLEERIASGWTLDDMDKNIEKRKKNFSEGKVVEKSEVVMNKEYIEFRETEEGSEVVFQIDDDDILELGEKINEIDELAYMNGYNWEALINFYLQKEHPDLLDGLSTDPEAGMYAAYYSNENAKKLYEVIKSFVENEEKVLNFVKSNHADILWD